MDEIKQGYCVKKRRIKKKDISLRDDFDSIEQALENYRKIRDRNKKKRIIKEIKEVEIL